ncbi:MAG TPA: hypothetical protein VGW10_06460 [Solirubrobacteraceae bacterium]|nr:hypothetical protein [Solirubrobacteraceae bacterium]
MADNQGMEGGPRDTRHESEELLRRALLDAGEAASVALKVQPLSTCDALTIVFHGRRDLGTIQTYVAHGTLGAGNTVGADSLLRVPCDLDLADASDRDEAEELYAAQAKALRDALRAADTVLAVWREPLEEAVESPVLVDRSLELRGVELPAHRLMPVALVAPERRLVALPVCGARTLAAGLPPMGIALAQQDVAHVYPLADDPARCVGDFLDRAAEHARRTAERLDQQEASVERFLELSGDDEPTA